MIVYAERGYAIDWDWSDHLTVWLTAQDRARQVVIRHQLDWAPRHEHTAKLAALWWWKCVGRGEARAVGGRDTQ